MPFRGGGVHPIAFWPRLFKNKEIMIRMLSSGDHRHFRSQLVDCFQNATCRTIEVY